MSKVEYLKIRYETDIVALFSVSPPPLNSVFLKTPTNYGNIQSCPFMSASDRFVPLGPEKKTFT